jgi:hypothetical protein
MESPAGAFTASLLPAIVWGMQNSVRQLLCGFAVLLAAVAGCDSGPAMPPVSRVVLLGIDGLDWRLLEPAIEAGRTPNLEALRAGGASGELATILPTYSPIIWASIATGMNAEKHGIDFFGARTTGSKVLTPYTSNSRRVKAIWNILSDRGREVSVAGWWNTWPAERVTGKFVSDRMLYTRFNLLFGSSGFGGSLPNQTWPPELEAELAPITAEAIESFGEFAARFLPGHSGVPPNRVLHDGAYELYLAYVRDRGYDALARAVHNPTAAFEAYYWNGVDIASHYFTKFRRPEEWPEPVSADEVALRGGLIDDYLSWVDERIGWLTKQAGPDTIVIVVSDHGFETGARSDSPNISGTHYNSAPAGVILIAGGAIPPGSEIDAAHIYDIAPSILYLLGEPVSREMDGQVIEVARSAGEGHSARDVEWVDSYEDGSRAVDPTPISTEEDATILERLEALGYMDSDGVPPPKEELP